MMSSYHFQAARSWAQRSGAVGVALDAGSRRGYVGRQDLWIENRLDGGTFISYRRDGSRHAAGRLFERLEKVFPREQLFMDIDTIEPGVDFLRVINAKLAECDAMLVG